MKATFFEEPIDQYACVERSWRKHVDGDEGPAIFYRTRPGEWQGHPDRWSVKYVLEGDAAFEIDGHWCDVFGGFAFMIPAQYPYRSRVRAAKTLSLFGRELAGADPEPTMPIAGVFALTIDEQEQLKRQIDTLRGHQARNTRLGPEKGVLVNLDVPFPVPDAWRQLHWRLAKWLEHGAVRVRSARQLLQARHFITAHFRSQDVCARAAQVANMTRSHFSRQFSALFGLSPRQYLVAYRSGVARSLLQSGAGSVESVAAQLGYRHSSSLAHLFQRQQLRNPRTHRVNRQAGAPRRDGSRSTG